MDSDQGKLFVGGISWETSEDILKDHFHKYGEVVESVIMRDRNTGSARGFGFVMFANPSVVDKALQDKHVILGRTVEVKRAVPRGEQNQNQHHSHQQRNKGSSRNCSNGVDNNNNQFRTKKIFVGGLSASLTEEEFKGYFEKFGRITDVVVMYDNATHRPRGFGFITFDSVEAVESVMQKNFHELNDKLVEVKRAVPKDGSNGNGNVGNNYSYNNSYNTRAGTGRGSLFGSYQGGIFPPYGPRYGIYPGYANVPLSGYGSVPGYPYGANTYGGGYPIGGYGGVGYGVPPIAAARGPWNGAGAFDSRRSPVPYGNAAFYPGYMNGGVGGIVGMAGCDYRGIMGPAADGKFNQGSGGEAQISAGTTPARVDGGKLDDDPSGLAGSYGASSGKQNQIRPDGRYRSFPIGNSS